MLVAILIIQVIILLLFLYCSLKVSKWSDEKIEEILFYEECLEHKNERK